MPYLEAVAGRRQHRNFPLKTHADIYTNSVTSFLTSARLSVYVSEQMIHLQRPKPVYKHVNSIALGLQLRIWFICDCYCRRQVACSVLCRTTCFY